MSTRRASLRTVVLAFVAAIIILLILLSAVGFDQVFAELGTADPQFLGAILAVALAWIVTWSISLHVVLSILTVSVSLRRSFLVYTNVLFVNNVAPFSVFGGQPVSAYLVSRATRADYETSLAAVASVAALNYVPAPPLAVGGLFYFGITTLFGTRSDLAVVAIAGLAITLISLASLGWRKRSQLRATLVSTILRVGTPLARFIPGIGPFERADVERRIGTVIRSLERIAVERRLLAAGVAGSTLGWVLLSSVLWLSLFAVGATVPLTAPLFVVPLATITNVVPLPGGLGTVDGTLVVLLVATANVTAPTATAAVLVYRTATLLFPILLGAAMTIAIQSRWLSVDHS